MRIYYGWIIVAISMMLLLLVVGTTVYSFGLFVLPVSKEFGLSRANMNTGLIVLNVGMAALSPFIGRALDRAPIRLVLGVSGLLFVFGLVILASSQSLLLSAVVLAGPIAAGVLGVGTLTTTAMVARWFVTRRARAMAIAAIGLSLGSVIVVPPVGLLIAALGWRQTLIIEAVFIGIVIALALPFVRERAPSEAAGGDAPSGQNGNVGSAKLVPESDTPWSAAELLKTPLFWMITISLGLTFGVLQTIVVSLIPFAQESGLSIAQAASLVSVYGMMAIVGKVILAWVGDRIDRVILLAAVFATVALTSAGPLIGQSYPALLLCSAVLGIAGGAATPAFTALLADRFGAASIGTAYGTASTILAIISAACIRLGGETYDRTGSYELMFISFAVVAAVATLVMFSTKALHR